MSKNQFLKDVKDIFPEGDLDRAYQSLLEILNKGEVDNSGNPIDYDYIMKKFSQFHQNWNTKYGKAMAKGFLSKEAESNRKNIYAFLLEALYFREFETTPVVAERDKYLFGNNPHKMYERIKQIEEKLFDRGW